MANFDTWHKNTFYPFLEEIVKNENDLNNLKEVNEVNTVEVRNFLKGLVEIENNITNEREKKKFENYFKIARNYLIGCVIIHNLWRVVHTKTLAAGVPGKPFHIDDESNGKISGMSSAEFGVFRQNFIASLWQQQRKECKKTYAQGLDRNFKNIQVDKPEKLKEFWRFAKNLYNICKMKKKDIREAWKKYCNKEYEGCACLASEHWLEDGIGLHNKESISRFYPIEVNLYPFFKKEQKS